MPAVPPEPTFPVKSTRLRPLLAILLVLICLAMAALQLWRADTRGARFEQDQAARDSTPIALTPQSRVAETLVGRVVTARGRWLADKTLFLDNKIHHGRPGYHVLTPLQLSGSDVVVVVNRGWTPAPRLRSELPPLSSPPGEVALTGIARGFESRTFELATTEPQGAVWQHVRAADYRRLVGLDALPLVLLQTGPGGDDLIRDWRPPENPATRHHGYAAMWFVFALMAAGYGLFVWRQK